METDGASMKLDTTDPVSGRLLALLPCYGEAFGCNWSSVLVRATVSEKSPTGTFSKLSHLTVLRDTQECLICKGLYVNFIPFDAHAFLKDLRRDLIAVSPRCYRERASKRH